MSARQMRFLHGLTLVVLTAAACPLEAALPPGIEILTARPANSFITGEAVEVLIRCDRPSQQATWAMVDRVGAQAAAGVVRVGAGEPALLRVPRPLGVGCYTLRLRLASGEVAEDALCVLPPPGEGRGDGRLFGIGFKPRSEAEWQILAQMGARHVRAEFPWPEVERRPGEYDLAWVDDFAAAAERHGIQLTVLTGHTPRHYGQRPIDAEGRVASAWYTWQPTGTIEWYAFIRTMAQRLLGRRLDAKPAHPTDTLPRGRRPFVVAWEVWSEADQNFYYGAWDRYLDMLRIAWCTIRSRERVPVVYGSCGHMTEMQFTLQARCGDYFDRVAYHPSGPDPDYELMHWFRNMPQKLIAEGCMRETAFTECDFHAPQGEGEPGFILRLYATLRAWRQDLFIRSGCTGGVFSATRCPYALVWIEDGRYLPRPAYVAFAVARWLIEPARYVGPLQAPEGVRLELFMREGVPMVVAWTNGGAHTVRLRLGGAARLFDCMGAQRRLHGSEATVELSADAVAIVGVAWDYAAEALAASVERALQTELGHESPHNSAYIDTLAADAALCVSPEFAPQLRAAVASASETATTTPPHAAAALFEVQRLVGDAMVKAARSARAEGRLLRLHTNTIWRLAQLLEHLGEIADGLGERWHRMNNVSPGDLTHTRERILQVLEGVSLRSGGAQCPFVERLADRALERLEVVTRSGGHDRGAWWAATLEARAAHALAAIEEPRLLRAFIVGTFPTAQIVTKGTLLSPGAEHTLEMRMYNFLPEDISAPVSVQLPVAWSCAQPTVQMLAPAQGVSELAMLRFAIPEEPRPWVVKTVQSSWRNFEVDLPPPLAPNERLYLTGEAGERRPPMTMAYRLFVGAYPSRAAGTQTQVATPRTQGATACHPGGPTGDTRDAAPSGRDIVFIDRWRLYLR
ncbi:MAG: hypothetical protein AB7Y46_14565 [Armatimonadota bacterium]